MNRDLATFAFLLINISKRKSTVKVFTVLLELLIPRNRLLIGLNLVRTRRLYLQYFYGIYIEYHATMIDLIFLGAAGKVFALQSKNNSQGLDLAEAEKACVDLSARLATAEELKRAVLDCSFIGCTTGWLADGTAG